MTFKRNIYLRTIDPAEAVTTARKALDRGALVGNESLPSHLAVNRVLASAVHARFSCPTFHSAAMDGYAVAARSTFTAREGFPVTLAEGTDAIAVNTGHPLPAGCDAVIMIEHVTRVDGGIAIEAPVFPWQHVRRMGEDIVATELLFPRHHRIAPWDIGALLAAGVWDVPVWATVTACIIPTGDEVLDFTSRPEPGKGQVVESNSQMLAALIRNAGCEANRVPPVPDNPDALHAALCAALDSPAQVVLLCAGSSAGSKDFTRSVIEREGEVLVHGISVMPGKPSILGQCRGKLVVGVPGYPVSALVCFEELVAPLLAWLSYRETEAPRTIHAELARALPSRVGMEEHVRLSVGKVGEKIMAIPLQRGAGNITTVTRAQAMTRIPAPCEGLPEGSRVEAELMVGEQALERLLVCVGSHDNTLDVLADELMGHENPFQMVSTHVGRMGGITALKNGACHMAGMHLFDPASEDFNFPFLAKFLPGRDVTVVNLAIRHQGLMVQPGNPLGIRGLADLARVRFINRQRGSGTRILLDHHLTQTNLSPASLAGYDKEEVTHMAVAVNVLTGTADCGMGIFAAARALDLDFVPLALERYDLVIPTQFMDDPRVTALMELLQNPRFKERIEAQGGYETRLTGQTMQPGMGLGA